MTYIQIFKQVTDQVYSHQDVRVIHSVEQPSHMDTTEETVSSVVYPVPVLCDRQSGALHGQCPQAK